MAKRPTPVTEQEIVNAVIKAMADKKAFDIVTISFNKMRNMVCDSFVICHATSRPQAEAIADAVEYQVRMDPGLHVRSVEGRENAEWILLDYGDVVVHIFQENTRKFYSLEDLWADAEIERHDSMTN